MNLEKKNTFPASLEKHGEVSLLTCQQQFKSQDICWIILDKETY